MACWRAWAQSTLLLTLDLAGTFAFALNGSITGLDAAKLDIVGMLALGMTTAFGGGILRGILIGALPPATFSDWRYLVVAAAGALLAFFLSGPLRRFALPIELADAAGLSLFCVTGAGISLEHGLGAGQAVVLGAHYGVPAALGAALACFLIRVLGIRYNLNAPVAREARRPRSPEPPGSEAGPGDLPVLND